MVRSIFGIIVLTIVVCLVFLLVAIVQGHAGCVLGMHTIAPVGARFTPDELAQAHAMVESECAGSRRLFEIELAATVAAGVAAAIARARSAGVPRPS